MIKKFVQWLKKLFGKKSPVGTSTGAIGVAGKSGVNKNTHQH